MSIGVNFVENSKDKILEIDLYKPVRDVFIEHGYTVRSEVKDCDITAIKDEELVVVELKVNLSVSLLAQAVKRQKAADLVYIAVPKPKKTFANSKWQDVCHLIRRLELGLILVSFKGKRGFVEIPIHPVPFDREKSKNMNKKKRESIIKEANARFMDFNVGGSSGKKLLTAYRESAIFIACCLKRLGPLSPKQLRSLGTDPKKTTSILSENHYGWFKKVERGVYSINEAGCEGLEVYKELADYFYNKLELR
jgi:hypothetical protein